MMEPQKRKPFADLGKTQIGINMAAGMAFFAITGYFIDQRAGTDQAWTLAGIFLGLFYCGYEVWKVVRQSGDKK